MNRLLETKRSELLNKSISAKATKSYNTTRYDRRTHQHVLDTTNTFNEIDMNAMFKSDILLLKMPVQGETSKYEVDVVFDGVCKDIGRELKKNNYNMEYKVVYKAIIRAINNQDIYIGCTCSDWKFRFAHYATKGKFNAGKAQVIPANQTNPNDDQGAACKHVLNVLANLDWALKLATTVYNYIVFMDENMHDKYENIIFPMLYGMKYDDAINRGIITTDEPELDQEEIEEEPPVEEPEEVEDEVV